MNKIKALIMLLIFAVAIIPEVASAKEKCRGHWRDYAYDTKIIKRYNPYAHCIWYVAYQFELPEELLYSIVYHERGDVNGKCMVNNNKTEDCGPAQINDVKLPEIKRFGLTKTDMKTNACRNIWTMGLFIREHIEKANGVIWMGVGNYHYHYKVSPKIHDAYVEKVRAAWIQLIKTINDKCY